MNNNEATGISIQDLEQWFDEELELYGNIVLYIRQGFTSLTKLRKRFRNKARPN